MGSNKELFNNLKYLITGNKFKGDFRAECEGEPSQVSGYPAREGWVITDPKKAINTIVNCPEEEVVFDVCRDGGTMNVRTKGEEFVFLYHSPSDKPDYTPFYRPYALRRYYKSINAWAPFGLQLSGDSVRVAWVSRVPAPSIFFETKEELVEYCKKHYRGGGYVPVSLDIALKTLGLTGNLTSNQETYKKQLTAEKDNLLVNSLENPSIIVLPYRVNFVVGNSVIS